MLFDRSDYLSATFIWICEHILYFHEPQFHRIINATQTVAFIVYIL